MKALLGGLCGSAALGVTVVCLSTASMASARLPSVSLPAAGVLLVSRAEIHAGPDRRSRLLRVMHRFRRDAQFQIVLALRSRVGVDGYRWYQLSLPGRPNGQRGWVRGDLVDLHAVRNRIVVDLGSRTIEVRRIRDAKLLLRSVAAVGKAGAPTPTGRNFYVQGQYTPDDPFFGPVVLETSAYSKLSDWPGGGLAGIHGTGSPGLLGKAVSHGCVRVSNAVDVQLARLAPLGTPIDLVP